MNSYADDHPYPRVTDPAYEKYLEIEEVTKDTIQVNVGASPAGQQYTHTNSKVL